MQYIRSYPSAAYLYIVSDPGMVQKVQAAYIEQKESDHVPNEYISGHSSRYSHLVASTLLNFETRTLSN